MSDENNNQSQHNGKIPENEYFPEIQPRTLKDYFRIAYRYRWLITGIFVLVFGYFVYSTLTATRIYQSHATVMISGQNSSDIDQLFSLQDQMTPRTLNNQIEYLKSRVLAEEVIHSLENTQYAGYLYLLNSDDGSSSSIIRQIKQLPGKALQLIRGPESENNVGLSSQRLADKPEINGQSNPRIRRLVERLHRWMSVSPVPDADIIKISVEAPDPDEASLIANTVANVYYQQNVQDARGEMTQVKSFIKEQLDNVSQNLQNAETALKNYQQKSEAIALDQSTETLVEQIADLQSQYDNTIVQRQAIEKRTNYLKSQLNEQEKKIVTDILEKTPSSIKVLRDTLSRMQMQLIMLQSNPEIPSDHPELLRTKQRISELEKQLKSITEKSLKEGMRLSGDPLNETQDIYQNLIESQTESVFLESKENSLRTLVKQYNSQFEQLPEKSLKMAQLLRDQKVNEELFMLLRKRYEETRIAEAGKLGDVRIMEPAVSDYNPVKPNVKRDLLLGALLGLIGGLGVALVLDYFDSSVRTTDDLERLGLSTLGTIPVIDPKDADKAAKLNGSAHPMEKEARKLESRLITHFDPKSPISEAYRMLRTNLQYSNLDQPVKSTLVTSPGPGEGKSTTAVNLAITMAQMGNRTVIVDTDLRRPVLHKIFDVPRIPGVSEVLIGMQVLEDVITESSIENLSIIGSGELPPNPSELLGSQKFRKFLEDLSKKFDRIVLDSPPVIAVADATILSRHTTDTLLVVSAGNTEMEALKIAKQQISDIGGHLAGTLLNQVNVSKEHGYYNYYYKYYRYYGKQSSSPGKRKKKHI